MAVIYKATNTINGKSYIGFDSNWPHRKYRHLHSARKGKDSDRFLFHKAINKYGEDNFVWEVIKEDATLDDEVTLIESHETYWETGKGYNLTKGGDGNLGWKPDDEVKKKISEKAKGNTYCKGRVLSEETKQKIANSLKGKPSGRKGIPSPLRGRKQSKELVEKRIAARMKTINERKAT